jgi:hypothetical protein
MDSSQSPTLNDQRHEGDVVSLVSKDLPTTEEARSGEPARDPDTGRNSSDQAIGMVRKGSDCAARMPAAQPFPLASKDLPTAEEARSGEPARDPDAGRDSSDQHIRMVRESASGKPSIGRRAFRSVVHFFITALIAVLIGVGASSAWQSYGDDAKEMVRTWAPSLDRLSSAWQSRGDEAKRMIKTWALSLDGLMKKSPPDVDIAAKQKGSSPAAAITQKPVPAAVAVPFESAQQLKTMAHDLTVMRQRVEQLAVKQEQMAHNIASLQAVEQDIKPKMRSPLLPPAASLPPRKNAPRVAPPQPPARVSILADWSIRDARDGYVTVQGHGDAYRVVPGTPLPGLGPVEQIKRQDGHWVVVTPKGIIVPRRGPQSDDEDDVFDGARVNRDDNAD